MQRFVLAGLLAILSQRQDVSAIAQLPAPTTRATTTLTTLTTIVITITAIMAPLVMCLAMATAIIAGTVDMVTADTSITVMAAIILVAEPAMAIVAEATSRRYVIF
jgi:hypothetical protein